MAAVKSTLEGKKAPAIKLLNQDEEQVELKDLLGSYVVIFFYPKDMTPGCTTEACSFQDNYRKLQNMGVEILGISCDDTSRHRKFADKYKFKYDLLADTEQKVVQKYGVWVEKNMYGKKYMGIRRDSFLVDPKGKIVKHYQKVKPAEHVAQVIADVKELQG
ncbi:MAG: thioredoxin-dependent thiol peroxidase [Candidatus Melainabacteria bacterium]|nr:thioredoxin-dependent thiol peroxidase [Candidatus Melainabacteria bacterium]